MPAVRLSAMQYRLLERYAQTLPPTERETFRHSVLERLRGEPSLAAVEAAITTTLDRRPAFMCAAGDNEGAKHETTPA
jgi:hypothetical protein